MKREEEEKVQSIGSGVVGKLDKEEDTTRSTRRDAQDAAWECYRLPSFLPFWNGPKHGGT